MIREPITTPSTTNQNKPTKPDYKLIEKVLINKNILKSLIKFCENTTNNQVEGQLYGHEEENEIKVELAMPVQLNSISKDEGENIKEYLKLNRLDFIQIGYFVCKEFSELLRKRSLKQFIDFQTKFPNAVFIYFDYSLYKENNYAFQCFRISKAVMEIVDKLDIEEDKQDISKKSIPSEDLLKNLNFSFIENHHSLFSTVVSTNYSNLLSEPESILRGKGEDFKTYKMKNNLLTRLNEVNKISEKFIEEQKKYINYYKIKKQFGKTKESEFLELLNKKGNELANLDKIDMSIYSKNIISMNERVKTAIDRINLKNAFNLEC